jgi:hypothetical protein
MPFLLDADSFITSANRHYRFSFCPGYWDWILRENAQRNVFSVDEIRKEIARGSGALTNWVTNQAPHIFLKPDLQVTNAAKVVSSWIANPQRIYSPAAVNTFMGAGDFWLISHALAYSWTVVTLEVSAPGSKARAKIPDVCAGLGIDCVDPFKMLESSGARLII